MGTFCRRDPVLLQASAASWPVSYVTRVEVMEECGGHLPLILTTTSQPLMVALEVEACVGAQRTPHCPLTVLLHQAWLMAFRFAVLRYCYIFLCPV